MLILACATRQEADSVLGGHATRPDPLGRMFSSQGHDFLLVLTGIGPVAAALNIAHVLTLTDASGLINMGICGAFDAHLPLGSLCAASAEIWPEYGVRTEEKTAPLPHQMLPLLPLEPSNRLALDPRAAAASMGISLPPCVQGVSLTVAGVSGDRQRAETLRAQYCAVTENMEGFALALAARQRGIPFLELRTVSNMVGERDKSAWDFRRALTALTPIIPLLTGAEQ